ncbi:hypothetical protein RU86_GL000741 [Lactococcus piscium]|uniref:Uncharacterized protein n=1 Tax=Pseudolactococcus piscium TaxID=1364 RepID=A0A2A5RWB6_9LACT|nr:hypothetical protein [Lactococcus piscium]PCS05529.1 hypothetical protein RU86_GL000741 [Lactococcus piscium]
MDKFRKAKIDQKAENERAEVFADVMDMIARERSVKHCMGNKKLIYTKSLWHAQKLVETQLDQEYSDLMTNTPIEEITIFRNGALILYTYWGNAKKLDPKLIKLLSYPERFETFNDYIKELVCLAELERVIKILGEHEYQ